MLLQDMLPIMTTVCATAEKLGWAIKDKHFCGRETFGKNSPGQICFLVVVVPFSAMMMAYMSGLKEIFAVQE